MTPPPPVAGEERVIRLGARHHDEIGALLDEAHPETTTRPGDGRVHGW